MKIFLLIIMLCLPISCFGNTNIVIDADLLEMDIKNKTAIFKNNVIVKSDQIDLKSDIIEVNMLNNDLNQIQFIKAYMQNNNSINALIKKNNTIQYNVICKRIDIDIIKKMILIYNAYINNHKTKINGDEIIYDMKTEKITILSKTNKVKIEINNDIQ